MASYRLPNEIEDSLDELSGKTGRSKTYYVTEALKFYLQANEERFLLENAIKEFYEGDRKTYTLAEVREQLRSRR